MDTGDIAIVATLAVGFVAFLLTLFALMRQSNNDLRVEIRETRVEVREMRNEIRLEMRAEAQASREQFERQSVRISEAEREQARIEGANRILSDVLRQQSHTHEVSAD